MLGSQRDWRPLRFFTGPSQTWKTQQARRDACLSEATDIEAALNRVITEVAGLGLWETRWWERRRAMVMA